ncbi:uncharacterized protein MYCFIDRAFT_75584 [Pseudocercospora fijiensis CIRAD86]|uniref:F-box domain-containing protein n=1 Tax=Pseudocercospora fijiensis (strain CIRAD86) TaxID=383855 RepID=N1Q691_PSEFD|nr:uncharacterized protein MYCFIDRAFT_75584 [Pseudocercospora fijiensis CIRAD86]EME87744.1 hypothetical protein MYCFIDRAFT_75584 [Pseudocercospora fijiensis CIRAD86]
MDSLPVELLAYVVEFCDHASQKQLRGVNKDWEDLTNPHVFAHIYIASFQAELSSFQTLACSRLAKYVKKLTYFTDTLPKLSKKTYQGCIDLRPDFHKFRNQNADKYPDEPRTVYRPHTRNDVFSRAWDAWAELPRHSFTKKQINEGWEVYKRLFQEQKTWNANLQGQMLQQSFAKLPNLTEIEIARAMAETRSTSEWPLWSRIRQELLLGPDDWREQYTPEPDPRKIDFPVTEHAVLCLLEAIAQRNRVLVNDTDGACRPVTKLLLQHQFLDPSSLLANWSNSLYGTAPATREWAVSHTGRLPLATAFSNLTRLTMWLHFDDERPFHFQASVFAQLHHFLYAASKLQTLILQIECPDHFGEDLEDFNGTAPSANVFDTTVTIWPDITYLALSANVDTDKLLRFLYLHSKTIKHLRLTDMIVRDVPKLIDHLPSTISRNLETIYLRQLWHEGIESLPHNEIHEDISEWDLCFLSQSTDFNAPYEKSAWRIREN